jgi:hypothetical protein
VRVIFYFLQLGYPLSLDQTDGQEWGGDAQNAFLPRWTPLHSLVFATLICGVKFCFATSRVFPQIKTNGQHATMLNSLYTLGGIGTYAR